MNEIEFWFSIGSTYTYLSVERLPSIEKKYNIKFIWKPFSVRKIMIEMENIPFTPPTKKIKSDYMWRDIKRRAKFYGFNANVPAPYPLKEFDLVNQIAVIGMNEKWIVDYVRLTYQKWFVDGFEPGIEPNLSQIIKKIGLNEKETIKKANSDEIKNLYVKMTNQAKSKKIFGSPTFVIGNEIFWGDDRLEDAIKWINSDKKI
tara:strand:+ start:676 stop:1281 length:606 start_codon:yes stop_codon:yes gene_type:complete